jgi:hypothetical protein
MLLCEYLSRLPAQSYSFIKLDVFCTWHIRHFARFFCVDFSENRMLHVAIDVLHHNRDAVRVSTRARSLLSFSLSLQRRNDVNGVPPETNVTIVTCRLSAALPLAEKECQYSLGSCGLSEPIVCAHVIASEFRVESRDQ